MKRISFWILSTVSTLVLLFGYHTSTSSTPAASPGTSIVSGSTAGSSAGSTTSGSGGSGGSGGGSGSGHGSATTPSPSPAPSTVTGAVASTEWGPVQVQLTVQGSKITKVSVLQYPSGNSTDDEINAYALPILISETTKTQSAQIDMVSGATVTSTGYVQSLQSALDQAGI